MVLVDTSVPDQAQLIARFAPALARQAASRSAQSPFRTCAADIRSGSAGPGGPDPNNCFRYPPMFPPELSAALAAKVENPVQYETMASFIEGVDESFTEAINPARDYGQMPLVVLTATRQSPPPPGMPADVVEQAAAFQETFSDLHDELAALSSRGVNARVPGADHYVQRSKPQVVIDAVEAVVAEARAAAN